MIILAFSLITTLLVLFSLSYVSNVFYYKQICAILFSVASLVGIIFYAIVVKANEIYFISWDAFMQHLQSDILTIPEVKIVLSFALVFLAILAFIIKQNSIATIFKAILYCATASLMVIYNDFSQNTVFFWELCLIANLVLMCDKDGRNLRSIMHYASAHFISGSCLMAFVAASINTDYSLTYLLHMALIINCALIPFSSTLVEPYYSSGPNKVLIMQAYSSKASIVLMSMTLSGNSALIVLGALTCVYAIIFLILEDDIIKFLLYDTVGQLGLLAFAVGNGADITQHIISSLIYQTAFYMCACSVIHATNIQKFSHLSGLAKKMPIAFIVSALACASMGGLPLTSGFYSKIVISQSLSHHYLFSLFSYGMFISCGLKFVACIFFGKNQDSKIINGMHLTHKLGLLSISLMCIVPLFNSLDYVDAFKANAAIYSCGFVVSMVLSWLILPKLKFFTTKDLESIYLKLCSYTISKSFNLVVLLCKILTATKNSAIRNATDAYSSSKACLHEVEELDYTTYPIMLVFLIILLAVVSCV